MKSIRTVTSIVVAYLVGQTSPASAFVPSLNQTQISDATYAGRRLSEHHRGYRAPENVLFAAADSLQIRKRQSPIEAILVGTPYERVRYTSYLYAFQGLYFSAEQAQTIARDDANTVQFIVFAHSNTPQDRNFLNRFVNGRLRLGDHAVVTSKPSVFGPALDYYNVEGVGRQFRWVGSVTFRFDLGRLRARRFNIANASGSFAFTDSEGERLKYPIDLSRYP